MKRRAILLVAIMAAAPALAEDSVVSFSQSSDGAGSVITIHCDSCPPLEEKDQDPNVHGVQVTETIIGGQKKIVQTDNLMGGSAVRYVKTSPSNRQSAGEVIGHSGGGTNVTVGHGGTIHVPAGRPPLDLESAVSYSGGGEFNVQRVERERQQTGNVDAGSQTSSVTTSGSENVVIHRRAAGDGDIVGGTEMLELRPTH